MVHRRVPERGVATTLRYTRREPPLNLGDGGRGSRRCQPPCADPQRQARGLEGCNDARTGMPARVLAGAMCVQRFDGSLNSAIHITYRISLRSSSMPEPRDPLLKVLIYLKIPLRIKLQGKIHLNFVCPLAGPSPRRGWGGPPKQR